MPSSSFEQNESIELLETPTMARSQQSVPQEEVHEPLLGSSRHGAAAEDLDSESETSRTERGEAGPPFSWITYFVFLLLGIAMLWSWNMFLAAAPYFQSRFRNDKWILNHFQAAETSAATLTNLVGMLVLSNLQKNASYPRRIVSSLLLNLVTFTVLAVSTYMRADPPTYFGFLVVLIVVSNISTSLIQNGVFSFTAGFGRQEYTQASMTGQAVAGVLPPLIQIISVAAVRPVGENADVPAESPKSAFIYFLTATGISGLTLVAFTYLLLRKARHEARQTTPKPDLQNVTEAEEHEGQQREVSLVRVCLKIPYMAAAVIICFAVTMVYPVFTSITLSVNGINPAIFIPLAFLIWNVGDLLGRLSTLWPAALLTHYPFALFCLSMARLLFIPLYFLCNIKGNGATFNSDFFYLGVVQLLFGVTNGYLGSNCMMGAGDWVAPEERTAAGGLMATFLVAGLTIGSFLSFLLGDI